jgi:hypothetical protein
MGNQGIPWKLNYPTTWRLIELLLISQFFAGFFTETNKKFLNFLEIGIQVIDKFYL